MSLQQERHTLTNGATITLSDELGIWAHGGEVISMTPRQAVECLVVAVLDNLVVKSETCHD